MFIFILFQIVSGATFVLFSSVRYNIFLFLVFIYDNSPLPLHTGRMPQPPPAAPPAGTPASAPSWVTAHTRGWSTVPWRWGQSTAMDTTRRCLAATGWATTTNTGTRCDQAEQGAGHWGYPQARDPSHPACGRNKALLFWRSRTPPICKVKDTIGLIFF